VTDMCVYERGRWSECVSELKGYIAVQTRKQNRELVNVTPAG